MSIVKNFLDAVKITAIALFFLLVTITFTTGVFPVSVFEPVPLLTIFSFVFFAITVTRFE